MSPHCDDEKKYGIVDKVVEHYKKLAADGGSIAGQKIRDLVTVNGVRVTLEDGTWGLVRASSNKPELVVVVESPVSEANMKRHLRRHRSRAVEASRSRRLQSEDCGVDTAVQFFLLRFHVAFAHCRRPAAGAIFMR